MNNEHLKISIITVVKNGMPFLIDTLKSFNLQKYSNKEHIVVYGNSNDGTTEYLLENKNLIAKLIKERTANKFDALNLGFKESTGDIIGILHADDIFYSENILSEISNKFSNSDDDILYGDILINQRNNICKIQREWNNKNYTYGDIKRGHMPPHTSMFIKRKAMVDVGDYSPHYKISSDYDYILRIYQNKNVKTSYINKKLTIMRHGGDSTGFLNLYKKTSEDLDIISKYYKFPWGILFFKIYRKIFQFRFNKTLHISSYIKKFVKADIIKVITNIRNINFKNNFILVGLNLAFLGNAQKNELIDQRYMYWPDGIFCKRLDINLNKIPGRNIVNALELPDFIKRITFIGNFSHKNAVYIKNKFPNKEIKNIKVPYGDIDIIKNSLPVIKTSDDEIIIMTLPTPKQEIIAKHISEKNKIFKIICTGGAIKMLSGEERPIPKVLNKLGLELIWRLQTDTFRRLHRLVFSFLKYLIKEYKGIYKNLEVKKI